MNPRVKYLGIPRRFISGTVIFKDKDKCAENAKVTLSGRGKRQTIRTNNFGDFEFEGLGEGEAFRVKVEYPGYAPQSFEVQTKTDVYLGEFFLKRSAKKCNDCAAYLFMSITISSTLRRLSRPDKVLIRMFKALQKIKV